MNTLGGGTLALIVREIDLTPAAATQLLDNAVSGYGFANHGRNPDLVGLC